MCIRDSHATAARCSQGRAAAKTDQCPLFSLVSLVLRPARPPIGLARHNEQSPAAFAAGPCLLFGNRCRRIPAMVTPVGFEPNISGLKARRPEPVSYTHLTDSSVNMMAPLIMLITYKDVYNSIMGELFPHKIVYAKKYESLTVRKRCV